MAFYINIMQKYFSTLLVHIVKDFLAAYKADFKAQKWTNITDHVDTVNSAAMFNQVRLNLPMESKLNFALSTVHVPHCKSSYYSSF